MLRIFSVLLLLPLLTHCGNTQNQPVIKSGRLELVPEPDKALREEYEKKKNAGSEPCIFSDPDTSVIGITLRNAKSTSTVLGEKIKLKGDPVDTFYSSDKKQRLGLTVHPGDGYNQVSIFTISYSENSKQTFRPLKTKEFETEKGIKLGTSKSELVEKLGPCYTAKNSTGNTVELYYTLEANDSKNSLLRTHHMPSYFANYRLANDKIERIEFGFEYP